MTDRPTTPASSEELAAMIEGFIADGTDYEQSAAALWKSAFVAFEYAAARIGVTGYQGSWAALRFYGEVMRVDGPFMIIKLEDALFPQYDLPGRLAEFISENSGWLAERARAKIAAVNPEFPPHPRVLAHWRMLAVLDENGGTSS